MIITGLGLNVGFGFDSRTIDYKLLVVGVYKDGSWIQPYLFSLNENCWKRVNAFSTNYELLPRPLHFVNGAVHWSGFRERNNGEYIHAILGFGLSPFDLSIMEYGESLIVVATHRIAIVFLELWVMKEYGVVESWTKVLTLHTGPRSWIQEVLGFRKNGKVLLHMGNAKMAALDLNSQQMEALLYLNNQQIELHAVDVGVNLLSIRSHVKLLSVKSYVESLVLLDKAGNDYSESDLNHSINSSDYDESSGGE
ncbi:hypothetical protein GQ457_02G032200 [Hibiscus cannabinus]